MDKEVAGVKHSYIWATCIVLVSITIGSYFVWGWVERSRISANKEIQLQKDRLNAVKRTTP